ncbi:MAG: hypothetical protein JNL85_07820 [Rubrivivax sp.]|nr:hypothetical protein [Rubrivivax sp.]
MPSFAEVSHDEWIAAPEARVRSQFADLEHHIATGVHPKLALRVLGERGAGGALRYEQRVKLLGLTQRDVFERRFTADGAMVDTSVEGFNRGGSLAFRFTPEPRGGAEGTCVHITIRLPLPPLVGPLLRPLLQAQVRRELRAAAAEDKHDLEVRGYRPAAAAARPPTARAGTPAAAVGFASAPP